MLPGHQNRVRPPRRRRGDSLPQMDHELVGRLEQPPEELASHLELSRPIVRGRVRVEVLMEHSAPFSPAVTVTHEHEVPVAADPG